MRCNFLDRLNFDNLGKSLLSLLHVATLQGWRDIVHHAVDSTAVSRIFLWIWYEDFYKRIIYATWDYQKIIAQFLIHFLIWIYSQIGDQPHTEASPGIYIFFILFYIICVYFTLFISFAAVQASYNEQENLEKCEADNYLTDEQKKWLAVTRNVEIASKKGLKHGWIQPPKWNLKVLAQYFCSKF